jgi:hypothetical protein
MTPGDLGERRGRPGDLTTDEYFHASKRGVGQRSLPRSRRLTSRLRIHPRVEISRRCSDTMSNERRYINSSSREHLMPTSLWNCVGYPTSAVVHLDAAGGTERETWHLASSYPHSLSRPVTCQGTPGPTSLTKSDEVSSQVPRTVCRASVLICGEDGCRLPRISWTDDTLQFGIVL